jgi:hypothetical protein
VRIFERADLQRQLSERCVLRAADTGQPDQPVPMFLRRLRPATARAALRGRLPARSSLSQRWRRLQLRSAALSRRRQ